LLAQPVGHFSMEVLRFPPLERMLDATIRNEPDERYQDV
jgi:hypothetical protein